MRIIEFVLKGINQVRYTITPERITVKYYNGGVGKDILEKVAYLLEDIVDNIPEIHYSLRGSLKALYSHPFITLKDTKEKRRLTICLDINSKRDVKLKGFNWAVGHKVAELIQPAPALTINGGCNQEQGNKMAKKMPVPKKGTMPKKGGSRGC